MISGSASLPDPVWHRWHFITGQRIVERYGMTEIGSVLSIPLTGPRRPGFVGTPAPGVRLRIAAFRPSPAGTRGPYDVLAEFDLRGLQSRPLPDEGLTHPTACCFDFSFFLLFRILELAVWKCLANGSRFFFYMMNMLLFTSSS